MPDEEQIPRYGSEDRCRGMDNKCRGMAEDFNDCSIKTPYLLATLCAMNKGAAGDEATLEGVIRTSAPSSSILSRIVR